MSALVLRAAAAVDAQGLVASSGFARDWRALGIDPRVDRWRWSAFFPTPFPEFRQLDPLARAAAATAEAAGTHRAPLADDTALLHVGSHGSLESDWRFQQSLGAPSELQAGLFPYTLPSSCLAPLAIRYGLRGPTLAFSVAPGRTGAGLAEALASLDGSAALVILGDWVGLEAATALGMEPVTEVVALRIEAGDPLSPGLPPLAALCAASDPARLLIAHLRGP